MRLTSNVYRRQQQTALSYGRTELMFLFPVAQTSNPTKLVLLMRFEILMRVKILTLLIIYLGDVPTPTHPKLPLPFRFSDCNF